MAADGTACNAAEWVPAFRDDDRIWRLWRGRNRLLGCVQRSKDGSWIGYRLTPAFLKAGASFWERFKSLPEAVEYVQAQVLQ